MKFWQFLQANRKLAFCLFVNLCLICYDLQRYTLYLLGLGMMDVWMKNNLRMLWGVEEGSVNRGRRAQSMKGLSLRHIIIVLICVQYHLQGFR